MAKLSSEVTKTDKIRRLADTTATAAAHDEIKVIKQLAAIICKNQNDKTAQRKAVDEIEAILKANPHINVDSAINPAFPSITLASLSVLMNNIPVLLTLISFGATSVTLKSHLGSKGTVVAITTETQIENLTAANDRVIQRICEILKLITTDEEDKSAASKIYFLLLLEPITVDLNIPISLVDSDSGASRTTCLLDMVIFKYPNTARMLIRFGAKWTPKLIKLGEEDLQFKKTMEIFDKYAKSHKDETELARKLSLSLERSDAKEKKSKAEDEKAQKSANIYKFKKECTRLLNTVETKLQELLSIYRTYCYDLNFAVLGGLTSEKTRQQNTKILWATAESISLGHQVINNSLIVPLRENDPMVDIRWVHAIYYAYTKYQITLTSLTKEIDLLPIPLKNKVQDLVNYCDRILTQCWKKLNTVLSVCSNGYSKRYVNLVKEKSLYEIIWNLEENKTHDELIAINNSYLLQLKEEIRKKIETIENLFETLKSIFNDISAFNVYKRWYLDTIESNFRKIMAMTGNDNESLNSADKFIKYSLADGEINFIYPKNFITVKNAVQAMLKANHNVSISVEMLREQGIHSEKTSAVAVTEPLVSYEAVRAQEKIIANMREVARRARAQEFTRLKANYEAEQAKIVEARKKIENEKILAKNKIMANVQKLTKEELQLFANILQSKNSNDSMDESRIKSMVKKLNLPNRQTTGSSGGLIITIHKTTVTFHHKHHSRKKIAGKLDDAFIADLRKALNEIGITFADVMASKPANTAAADNTDFTGLAARTAAAPAVAAATASVNTITLAASARGTAGYRL